MQSISPKKYDDLFNASTYYFAFLSLCCFTPVIVLTVYFFNRYLTDAVKKRQYLQFVITVIAVYILGTGLNFFTATVFLGTVRYSIPLENNFRHRLELANWNTRWAIILGIVVIGIELAKSWYLKSHDNLRMLRTKARAEMRVKKSRINPTWLFRSLDKIQTSLDRKSQRSTSMILNLSDLLSYSLYDGDAESIELEKEFIELQHLISLEQSDQETILEIAMQIDGDTSGKTIGPMSVINKIVELVHQVPHPCLERCQLKLHFHVGENLLRLNAVTVCNNARTTKSFAWALSSMTVNDITRNNLTISGI